MLNKLISQFVRLYLQERYSEIANVAREVRYYVR